MQFFYPSDDCPDDKTGHLLELPFGKRRNLAICVKCGKTFSFKSIELDPETGKVNHMSVTTAADGNIDKVRDLMQDALDLLHETTRTDCWGWDEYSSEHQASIRSAYSKIASVLAELS